MRNKNKCKSLLLPFVSLIQKQFARNPKTDNYPLRPSVKHPTALNCVLVENTLIDLSVCQLYIPLTISRTIFELAVVILPSAAQL
jgi:hypothetical protein